MEIRYEFYKSGCFPLAWTAYRVTVSIIGHEWIWLPWKLSLERFLRFSTCRKKSYYFLYFLNGQRPQENLGANEVHIWWRLSKWKWKWHRWHERAWNAHESTVAVSLTKIVTRWRTSQKACEDYGKIQNAAVRKAHWQANASISVWKYLQFATIVRGGLTSTCCVVNALLGLPHSDRSKPTIFISFQDFVNNRQ